MSRGDRRHHDLSGREMDRLLDDVLANPAIKARLARPYRLLTIYDIALLGSSSIGGAHVYLDRHLRENGQPYGVLKIKGRPFDIRAHLVGHERLEQAIEDVLGWPYLMLAHPLATHAENRSVTMRGGDPVAYEAALKPFIKADESERITKTPSDLDMRPLMAWGDDKVIAQVKAVAQKEKRDHASVGYVGQSQRSGQQCSKCAMFIAEKYVGPACTGVQSPIAPDGWCRRFKVGKLDDPGD